ncbi:MAG: diguanylate cyclase [Halanaerobiales bacterium]
MGDYSRAREKMVKDSLTALHNNRFFKRFLHREMKDVCQQVDLLSVLMLELDKFKEYNDTLGHQAGDHVLEDTSRIIIKNIRNSDLAARYGGRRVRGSF